MLEHRWAEYLSVCVYNSYGHAKYTVKSGGFPPWPRARIVVSGMARLLPVLRGAGYLLFSWWIKGRKAAFWRKAAWRSTAFPVYNKCFGRRITDLWTGIMNTKRRGQLLRIGVLAILAIWGCAEKPDRSVKQFTRQPSHVIQPSQWGPDIEGLQCRIRPIKRLWRAKESLVFRVDFRNQGKRGFAMLDDGSVHAERVLVDGRWYSRPRIGAVGGKPRMLGPGDSLEDLPLSLSQEMAIPLSSGSHTIQVAFLFEGLEVVSNAIDLEITP
jgi:hypothetical protein